jgi:hypothetical protein
VNKRIRLLAEQATTRIEPTATSGEGWIFDKEKFAELIVKDIHAYVDGLDTAQIISNGILKRYGVAV